MPLPDPSAREGAGLFAADEDDVDTLLGEEAVDRLAEPCQAECRIVEVGFTDQAGQNALLSGTRNQYVNLTRKRVRQGDADLVSDNQIGHTPPFMVRISPASPQTVRIKLHRSLRRRGANLDAITLADLNTAYRADQVNTGALDELAKLIVGEPSRFL